MADFATTMQNPADLSEDEQKKAGKPVQGDMGDRHKKFVSDLARMIEEGNIDPLKIETFLNKDVYDSIDHDLRVKTDLALPNIATLLTHIIGFYKSKQTPDACPQLETMIESLWDMKERIEQFADVFKF